MAPWTVIREHLVKSQVTGPVVDQIFNHQVLLLTGTTGLNATGILGALEAAGFEIVAKKPKSADNGGDGF